MALIRAVPFLPLPSPPPGAPAPPRRRAVVAGTLLALVAFAAPRAVDDTDALLAWWRFDEPAGAVLRDSGPGGFDCPRPEGGVRVEGRRGGALRVGSRHAALDTKSSPAPAPARNPTDSALNPGAGDWTVEGWWWLDPGAEEEGVWFEIGTGPREERDLITQLCVAPRENAVVLNGLAPDAGTPAAPLARRVEFPDPSGPPGGSARLLTVQLTAPAPLPRSRWFHVAVVHRENGELRLFLDGVPAAVAMAELRALPRGDGGYLALGCDGRGARPFPGALDDLRVSGRARYAARFDPAAQYPADDSP